MLKIRALSVAICLVFALACAIPPRQFKDSRVVLSPRGEEILITTVDNTTVQGEFLFCDQQAVYVLMQSKLSPASELFECPYSTISRLRVNTYINKSWRGFVLVGQIIPAILIGAAAGEYYDDMGKGLVEFALPASIWGLLSGMLFELSGSRRPQLTGSITFERLSEFIKFARYPYSPSADQKTIILESLARQSGQK